jgi:hypothetical protein
MAFDFTLLLQVLIAAASGLVWTILYKYANIANSLEQVDWTDFAANAIFGAGAAIVMAILGIPLTQDVIVSAFTVYAPIVVILHMIILNVKANLLTKVTFYEKHPVTGMYVKVARKVQKPTLTQLAGVAIRKMDQASRQFLVFDLRESIQPKVLGAVDATEAANNGAGTYQYAIEAAAWVFLIEGGELTGAVHYFYKDWIGNATVTWKVISDACLTQIRNTGRFISYNALY